MAYNYFILSLNLQVPGGSPAERSYTIVNNVYQNYINQQLNKCIW